jgi:hypothetical protein
MSTSSPEPRRFSIPLPRPLWIGLAAVALVGVAIGLQVGLPIYRQNLAVQEIERLGGKIGSFQPGPEWLRNWVGKDRMKLFDEVMIVDLEYRDATDTTLSNMSCLTGLHMLWLGWPD